jgi:hypothetical protein
MTNMNRIQRTDPRSLNDIDSTDTATREFHNEKAKTAAAAIARQYSQSPVFLKALSMALTDVAEKAYRQHMRSMPKREETYEEKREKIRKEVLAEYGLDSD